MFGERPRRLYGEGEIPRQSGCGRNGKKKREGLRMGGKKMDGTSIGTVAAYTALFLRSMGALTAHSVQSTDLHVIDRYVEGIKVGHVALYTVMFGKQKLLWYETLKEAIDAAEIA